MSRAARIFLWLCVAGLAVRVALIATTFGSTDAMWWTLWADTLSRYGMAGSYQRLWMMNHPPPVLVAIRVLQALASRLGVEYVDLFRAVQVAAELFCAAVLYRIGAVRDAAHGRALALFLLLSPGAAFIAAFHCNTDPTMIALVVTAAWLSTSAQRPASGGAVLGLAAGVKIVPLLFIGLFLASIPRKDWKRFIGAFAAVVAIWITPAVIAGGLVVLRRIFGYSGILPVEWGIPGLALAAAHAIPSAYDAAVSVARTYFRYGRFVVYALVASVWLVRLRDPQEGIDALLRSIALLAMGIFVVTPGWGVQYIYWIIPLLPFALTWRNALAVNGAIGIYLFVTYTVWSGGWPWWFADFRSYEVYSPTAAAAGLLMWSIVGVALISALRRPAAPLTD